VQRYRDCCKKSTSSAHRFTS